MSSIPEKSTLLKISDHKDIFTWDSEGPQNYADISATDWERSAEKVASLNPIRKRKHEGDDPDPLVESDQPGPPLKTQVNLENVGRDQGEELRALLETDKPVLIEGLENIVSSSSDDDLANFSSSESSSSSPAVKASHTEEEAKEKSKTSDVQHTTIKTRKRKTPSKTKEEIFKKKDYIDEILSDAFEMFYENGGKGNKGLIKRIDKKYNLKGRFCVYVTTLEQCVKKALTRTEIMKISKKSRVSYKRVIDFLPNAKLNRESFLNKKERDES